ncbi:MAG: AAA family ATPase [Phycisphaerae bacterium]|nr:AAA family ATPase [Phycisphaerae bacterium]NUQ44906.1 AAA family ATPase [Phycisphaerae bacterium]
MPGDRPEDLRLLIRSRHPFIGIQTVDEQRAAELVERVATDMGLPLFEWSLTQGMRRRLPVGGAPMPNTTSAAGALVHVADLSQTAIYRFTSLGVHLREPVVERAFRDLYPVLSSRRSTLILIDAAAQLSEPLQRLIAPFNLSWPSEEELRQVVREAFREASALHRIKVTLTRKQSDALVQNLRGLTRTEALRILLSVMLDDQVLGPEDVPRILQAKRAVLSRTGILENVPVDVEPDQVGGLASLKAWLARRRRGFTNEARDFGLDPPRGVLLLRVQGCGKSLCARVVAADWQLPLLRLDPGVLYQKYVGESESRLRQALLQAEAMAPAVLWIDEIEKAFASASADSADGGLSQRMFGSFLTWMQDRRAPIFLIATANDISALPPELVRKGRFDEVFFVDLPEAAARMDIVRIHLRRRGRDPGDFDVEAIAGATEGFSGAEIEQAIVSALYAAFAEDRALDTATILDEIGRTRPLSQLMAERLAELRAWAAQRCVPAD